MAKQPTPDIACSGWESACSCSALAVVRIGGAPVRPIMPVRVTRSDYEEITPMGRIAALSEVASVILWLCSDAASYITGALIPIDGATTL
jgi:NAD(P)-dependent dehydrogenase (short-subunit alcohol dehydrogenase family)